MYFSFVIPCYNAASTVAKTFASIQAQKAWVKQIIFVDDGSTDETPQILADYVVRYPEWVIFRQQENQGPGAARNLGVRDVTGEYVIFLDADDALREGALQIYHQAFREAPYVDMLIAGYCAVHPTFQKEKLPGNYTDSTRLIEAFWFGPLSIPPSATAMRASVLQAIQYPVNIRHGEDLVFFSRIMAQFNAKTLPFVAVDMLHSPQSLRNQTQSILREGDEVVEILFDAKLLNPNWMAWRNRFHARQLMGLAAKALKAKDKKFARACLFKAIKLYPRTLLQSKALKTCLRAW